MITSRPSASAAPHFPLAPQSGLPAWPCSTCQTVTWRKHNGQTVCGTCHDYGERLRMQRELKKAS
jgi:hypothetical protein